MVLITGYGKRVLGSGDDGTSKKKFCIHYAVMLVWMATDDVWVKKCSTNLPTPGRQCIVMCRSRCLLYGVVQIGPRVHRRITGHRSDTFCARSKIVHRWHIDSSYIVDCSIRKSRRIATCMRQVEFVDLPDQRFLGTAQGGLSRSLSIARWIGSHPKGSRIAG